MQQSRESVSELHIEETVLGVQIHNTRHSTVASILRCISGTIGNTDVTKPVSNLCMMCTLVCMRISRSKLVLCVQARPATLVLLFKSRSWQTSNVLRTIQIVQL